MRKIIKKWRFLTKSKSQMHSQLQMVQIKSQLSKMSPSLLFASFEKIKAGDADGRCGNQDNCGPQRHRLSGTKGPTKFQPICTASFTQNPYPYPYPASDPHHPFDDMPSSVTTWLKPAAFTFLFFQHFSCSKIRNRVIVRVKIQKTRGTGENCKAN